MLVYDGARVDIVSNIQGDSTTNRKSIGTVTIGGTTASDGAHSHTVQISENTKGGTSTTAVTSHENMPPFYILAFIMRVS
jgi:microcystin-dependent protein